MATQEIGVIGEREGGLELLSGGGALNAIESAAVSQQIATAKKYPRDVRKARDEAMALATLDEETATSMFYSLPRDGKRILGPSARLAEVIVYSWGNIRAQAIISEITDKHVTALGTCFDLEKNVAAQVEVRRRITKSSGTRFSEDMIIVTGNAACSIALRNAVFKVIPFALVKPVYDEAMQTAIGKAKSMNERRQAAVEIFAKMGIDEARMLTAVGRQHLEETTPDDIVVLRGLFTAIRDGDTTIDEAFPTTNENSKEGSRAADIDKRAADSAQQNGGPKPAGEKKAEAEDEKPKPSRRQQRAAAEKAEPTETVDTTTGEVTEDEPKPEPTVDPKLKALESEYGALLVERGKGDAKMRKAYQSELASKGLVTSADHTAWRKIDYMSAISELKALGAGPGPRSEEDEYEAAMQAKEAEGEQEQAPDELL